MAESIVPDRAPSPTTPAAAPASETPATRVMTPVEAKEYRTNIVDTAMTISLVLNEAHNNLYGTADGKSLSGRAWILAVGLEFKIDRAATITSGSAAVLSREVDGILSLVRACALADKNLPRANKCLDEILPCLRVLRRELTRTDLPAGDADAYLEDCFMHGVRAFADMHEEILANAQLGLMRASERSDPDGQLREAVLEMLTQIETDRDMRDGFASALTGYIAQTETYGKFGDACAYFRRLRYAQIDPNGAFAEKRRAAKAAKRRARAQPAQGAAWPFPASAHDATQAAKAFTQGRQADAAAAAPKRAKKARTAA